MEKIKFVDAELSETIAELLGKYDHKTLAIWAADCSEHVLPYFEEKVPYDERPRQAIEAGRVWVRGEITMSEARTAAFAAHAAARDTDDAAACAAARAAGHAAATAHVASHAVHAATYAAKAAAFSSADVSDNTAKERNWQLKHLLDLGGGGQS
ncbi:putative immunity protein [Paenibacillus sp. 481]|uniref:putative immunity protein n=1 Tax=Paenibacillus sp. 481 TaxID=2835869 RepID=UPI001E440FF7|nr:hypothetical protein [Paenibacillus sp. 481]UHA73499.1 hypothetical protein KIK04_23600 [Paenibacillus sp. 481]